MNTTAYWKTLEAAAPNETFRNQYRAFRLASQFKGLTKNQRRDFDYYLVNGRKEKCYPSFASPLSPDRLVFVAPTAEMWFWLFDTHGMEVQCEEAQDAGAVVQSKAFLNLSIKMWVEDVCNHLLYPSDDPTRGHPLPWVREAFLNQLKRAAEAHFGYLPTWVKGFW